jgi:P27 family predicted phage terminase small subunit
MRGRKPKPQEQHIVEGTYREDRHGSTDVVLAEPLSDAEVVKPKLSKEASAVWDITVPPLVEIGAVQEIDVPNLVLMCEAYATAERARKKWHREGMTIRGSTGTQVLHPAVRTEQAASKVYFQMSEAFGLSPMARTRLGMAELKRRSMAQDMASALGAPAPVTIEA